MRTDRAGQSALLFLDVAEILQRENVDYAVIGAFALSMHGAIRGTTDVDALLFTTPQQLGKLRAVFDRAGFASELRRGDPEDPILGMLILSDGNNNHVELLGGLRGMDPAIFSRTVEVQFRGVNLRFVGREDLIAMKCFAGGPQDLMTHSLHIVVRKARWILISCALLLGDLARTRPITWSRSSQIDAGV